MNPLPYAIKTFENIRRGMIFPAILLRHKRPGDIEDVLAHAASAIRALAHAGAVLTEPITIELRPETDKPNEMPRVRLHVEIPITCEPELLQAVRVQATGEGE